MRNLVNLIPIFSVTLGLLVNAFSLSISYFEPLSDECIVSHIGAKDVDFRPIGANVNRLEVFRNRGGGWSRFRRVKSESDTKRQRLVATREERGVKL